ncbi:chloride channel protein [Candidatus Neomarinimicrobiota bacterium]
MKIKTARKYITQKKSLYTIVQQLLFRIKSFNQLFILIIAVIIGVSTGYLAVGFRTLILFLQNILWGEGNLIDAIKSVPIYIKFGIPVIGSFTVALLVNKFAKEAKGHGVPEVMNAVATKNGFMRVRVVIVKALASALSIGSGASVGREGPIVQIGSAFGSSIGQIFQVSAMRMKTLVACGAAAGIAATFNAPIAGALFASEVILGDFSVVAIGPIIISSVFATITSRQYYGDLPAFTPPAFALNSPVEIIFYIILGITAGLIGWLFVKSLYYSEDLFEKSKLSVGIQALIGGSILGLFAIFLPDVLGVGYESMDKAFTSSIPFYLVVLILFGKIFATSISLGSGSSGGIFAPSLFMGSMLGNALGTVFHNFFPTITASPGAYALVGMAALVAATTHAPITAILIIFEMTSEYSVILPLMITSILATVITTRMLDGSIYTIKLKRKGIDIHGGTDMALMSKLQISRLKQQFVEIVREETLLSELLDKMSKGDQHNIYVCKGEDVLVGIVTHGMVRRYLNRVEEVHPLTQVKDICNYHFPTVNDNTPIHELMKLILEYDLRSIPVIDQNGILTGQVLRRDILREYQEMIIESQSAKTLASSFKYVHQYHHEKVEVIPGFRIARINPPSEFINQTIESLNVRKKYHVDILIIRKAIKDKMKDTIPTPSMRIKQNDQLIIFGAVKDIDSICEIF